MEWSTMVEVGDKVSVRAKAGPRLGVVREVTGSLLRVQWANGEETRIAPAAGTLTVVGKTRGTRAAAAAKKKAPAAKKTPAAKKKAPASKKKAPAAKKAPSKKKAPAVKKAPAAKRKSAAKKAAPKKAAPKKRR
jgi:hypothetical protein